MVAKITTGKDIYGALAYNQEKVNEGLGKVLATQFIREPLDGQFNISGSAEDFLRWMPSHFRTEKPVIHISLNPDPKDKLTDDKLAEIAGKYMDRMGWGEQPYMIFKHSDIDREHIHIVSIQVKSDGQKINDSKRNERSVAITEELEKEYGLCPAKGKKRAEEWRLTPVDPTAGNIKRQIASVIKPAAAMYRFQTLGEYRALLRLYNIGIEEVRGTRKGEPYRGILYTALDKNGEKTGTPLKSSLFNKSVGMDGLEKHFEQSGEKIKDLNIRANIRKRISGPVSEARSENELREKLRAVGIDLYLRRNDTGRITGVTFIDHTERAVLNGSRLGKEYSANVFNECFSGEQPNIVADPHEVSDTRQKQPAKEKQHDTHQVADTVTDAVGGLLSILNPEPDERPDNQPQKRKRKKKKRRYGRQM